MYCYQCFVFKTTPGFGPFPLLNKQVQRPISCSRMPLLWYIWLFKRCHRIYKSFNFPTRLLPITRLLFPNLIFCLPSVLPTLVVDIFVWVWCIHHRAQWYIWCLTWPSVLKYWEEAASTREWRWTAPPSSRWTTRSRPGWSVVLTRWLLSSRAEHSMLGCLVQRRQYWVGDN